MYSDGREISRFELGYGDAHEWGAAVAPDGTLWLLKNAEQGGSLYVITAEAVAASE